MKSHSKMLAPRRGCDRLGERLDYVDGCHLGIYMFIKNVKRSRFSGTSSCNHLFNFLVLVTPIISFVLTECKTEMDRLCEIHKIKSDLSRAVDKDEPTDLYGVKARIETTAVEDSKVHTYLSLKCLTLEMR